HDNRLEHLACLVAPAENVKLHGVLRAECSHAASSMLIGVLQVLYGNCLPNPSAEDDVVFPNSRQSGGTLFTQADNLQSSPEWRNAKALARNGLELKAEELLHLGCRTLIFGQRRLN